MSEKFVKFISPSKEEFEKNFKGYDVIMTEKTIIKPVGEMTEEEKFKYNKLIDGDRREQNSGNIVIVKI